LHQAGYKVAGVDISSEMIYRARERVPNKEIEFLQGNLAKLPFADHSCSGMMIINVLEWTEDPAEAIDELYRVVEQDGFICVGILGPTAGPRANSYPRLTGEKVICNTMMPWEFMRLATDKQFAYVDGFGVYKDGVKEKHHEGLALELQQALAFMWVFMLRKVENHHG
jgi:ubiquinone/menaquinone biosynthesis C-methylase UbiE